MKRKLVVLVALVLSLFCVRGFTSEYPFLRNVGKFEYNIIEETPDNSSKTVTTKYYYLSLARRDYIDAVLTCKIAGLEPLIIESQEEAKKIVEIAINKNNLFADDIFVKNNSIGSISQGCMKFGRPRTLKLKFNEVECDNEFKFMCQVMKVEEADDKKNNSEESKLEQEKNARSMLFSFLGRVGERADNVEPEPKRFYSYRERQDYRYSSDRERNAQRNKKEDIVEYYLSQNLEISPTDTQTVCQTFGMTLASISNYDKFRDLYGLLSDYLNNLPEEDKSMYRSGNYSMKWLVSDHSRKISDYRSDRSENNTETNKNCLAFHLHGYGRSYGSSNCKISRVSCTDNMPFICQLEVDKNISSEADYSDIFKQYFSANVSTDIKNYYITFIKRDWLNSYINCKLFGMELLTIETDDEEQEMKEMFATLNEDYLSNEYHVDATTIGKEYWYSLKSGNILGIDLETLDESFETNSCLYADVSGKGNVEYQIGDCNSAKRASICQQTREAETSSR